MAKKFERLSAKSQSFAGEAGASRQQSPMFTPLTKKANSFHGVSTVDLLRRRFTGSNLRIVRTDSHDTGRTSLPPPSPKVAAVLSEKVVIIVDAFTTGACMAEEAQKRGETHMMITRRIANSSSILLHPSVD